MYQDWDRFKSNEVLFHTLIEGLDPNTNILLDSAACVHFDESYFQGNLDWNVG